MDKLAHKYDLPVIITSLIITVIFVAMTIAMPEQMLDTLKGARDWVEYNLGGIIKFLTLAAIVFCVAIAFSKYGNIRFGKAKPKYSNWIWVVLIFCSSFSMSIMFWAVVEWAEYLVFTQPNGMDMEQTAHETFTYIFQHWGIPVWIWLIIGILPMGYNYYVRKKGKLDLVSTVGGIVGDEPNPVVKFIINFIFVYGTISALCISLGAGLPMLTHNLEPIFNIETGWITTVIVALLVTAVYTLSAVSGIDSGIRRFSLLCTWLTIPLLIWIFVTGHPVFDIENTVQGLGIHLDEFFLRILETYAGGESTGFSQMWTVFYFAWWISVCPCYWIFTVKISRGRSMRSIILVLMAAAVLSTIFFFGILTNEGLADLIDSGFDFATIGSNGTILDDFYNSGDEFQFVNDFLMSIPGDVVVVIVWFLASFFALTTMMDSSAFVMAEATSKNVPYGKDAPIGIRVFWAIVIMIIPMVMLWAGADTTTMKCLLVIAAAPVVVIIVMGAISLWKWVRKDFGDLSAGEINVYFMTDEERARHESHLADMEANPLPEESAEFDAPSASIQLNPFRKSQAKLEAERAAVQEGADEAAVKSEAEGAEGEEKRE